MNGRTVPPPKGIAIAVGLSISTITPGVMDFFLKKRYRENLFEGAQQFSEK